MLNITRTLIVIATLFCAPLSALAQQRAPADYTRMTLKLSSILMIGDASITEAEGSAPYYPASGIMVWGLEATYKLPGGLTFEGDFSYLADTGTGANLSPSAAGRVGYTFGLREDEAYARDTWRHYLVPSLGYRYARRMVYVRDERSALYDTQNIQAMLAYEFEAGTTAFSPVLRLSGGVDYTFWQRYNDGDYFDVGTRFLLNRVMRISVGFAFGG